MEHFPGPWYYYGASKAVVNYTMRKIHFENEWLVSAPIAPGWVKTDMGDFAAKIVGMESAPQTLEMSVKGLVERVSVIGLN